MTFADMARRASKLAIDNSPAILTSLGVVGTITAAYLAGKASFEAADIIRLKEAADEERGVTVGDPREILKQRVELVWKLYIPAASTGLAAVVCIIGANHVGSRRAAGLAAAYTLTEKTFDEYKAKVVEKIGARKEEAVVDEIAQDRVRETFLDDVKIYGLEGQICYDGWSDRYFRSSAESIRAAVNDLNHALIHDGYASADEFYQVLGLPSPAYAHQVGWNADRLLDVKISTTMAPGDIPCLAMTFANDPAPDYGRFH